MTKYTISISGAKIGPTWDGMLHGSKNPGLMEFRKVVERKPGKPKLRELIETLLRDSGDFCETPRLHPDAHISFNSQRVVGRTKITRSRTLIAGEVPSIQDLVYQGD